MEYIKQTLKGRLFAKQHPLQNQQYFIFSELTMLIWPQISLSNSFKQNFVTTKYSKKSHRAFSAVTENIDR